MTKVRCFICMFASCGLLLSYASVRQNMNMEAMKLDELCKITTHFETFCTKTQDSTVMSLQSTSITPLSRARYSLPTPTHNPCKLCASALWLESISCSSPFAQSCKMMRCANAADDCSACNDDADTWWMRDVETYLRFLGLSGWKKIEKKSYKIKRKS